MGVVAVVEAGAEGGPPKPSGSAAGHAGKPVLGLVCHLWQKLPDRMPQVPPVLLSSRRIAEERYQICLRPCSAACGVATHKR